MAKLKAMIMAVFALFIGMIIYSQLAPSFDVANKEIAKADTTGMATKTLETVNSVPDPKGDVKQGLGGFLLRLLENHPILFILLVIVVAVGLIYLGVTVYQVRNF